MKRRKLQLVVILVVVAIAVVAVLSDDPEVKAYALSLLGLI